MKEPFDGYARTTVAPISHASVGTAEQPDVEADAAEERTRPSATPPRPPAWAHSLRDHVSGLLAAAEARLADVQDQLDELAANRDGMGWEAIDGPMPARRGARVLLIIDELARTGSYASSQQMYTRGPPPSSGIHSWTEARVPSRNTSPVRGSTTR